MLRGAVERRTAASTAEAEFRQRLAEFEARTASAVASTAHPAVDDDDSSPFECNICLELAREPVVTYCGHLYCWPCLYRWLQVDGKCRTCPVCKSLVDKDKVVPIYGRGVSGPQDGVAPEEAQKIPQRPSGKPPQTSFMSMMFGTNPSQPSFMNSIFVLEEEINSPEHQHQAILARLLLMLGSFVIMFLLLI
mmetsp:Transcript_35301/g.99951  ORF Transcript_35301/g.99951 Transcript_35301/m.99951 type:complete len:192 (-) Transcript_35301:304-879(-)|eukprot:CAMPEP_0117670274 /NCGR_PEP_ID=MMETSP0804-20121206/12646_1 /TAXON_ID=1074897 /ORGANISM="Tetraselmis astigmatica, Strain CCMP880" /LENGTH=191 /DNA_ID=CAMNT_0005478523 /DNA_START=723 /DNA_END=1298 /DNA_ORIENTATION=+